MGNDQRRRHLLKGGAGGHGGGDHDSNDHDDDAHDDDAHDNDDYYKYDQDLMPARTRGDDDDHDKGKAEAAEAEPEAAGAGPETEPEFALTIDRSLEGGTSGRYEGEKWNQDHKPYGTKPHETVLLDDPERLLRHLLSTDGEDDHDDEAEAEAEVEAEAPGPEIDLAINLSLQGGTAGRYEGEEWNQDHKPYGTKPHRHLLLEDDHGDDHDGEAEAEPAAAAPGPELDLATSRSSITLDPATLSRPELRYGSYVGQLGKK